jgi:hypothetical protein
LAVGFKLLNRFCKIIQSRLGLNLGYQLTRLSIKPENFPRPSAPHFLSINLEPPRIDDDSTLLNPFGDKIAIVLQGAVDNKSHSLSSIISRYQNLYPLAHIILSTWEDENTDFLQFSEKFHLVKSNKPRNPGIANVNLQIASTCAGIELAEALGCQYVIKSRSDQMLLNSTFLINLYEIVHKHSTQKNNLKLVISSFNTFCFRKYSISDMFTFGEISEMKNFWFIPLDSRVSSELSLVDITDKESWCKLRVAENYISCLYLEKKGLTLDFTFQQYYKALSDYFVVVDAQELGQTWTKYTSFNPVYNLNNFPHSRSEVTSAIWKSLPLLHQNLASAALKIDDRIK